jgi:hypothetical protein
MEFGEMVAASGAGGGQDMLGVSEGAPAGRLEQKRGRGEPGGNDG